MILEAYMQPRILPAATQHTEPNPAFLRPQSAVVQPELHRPSWDPFDHCGSAASQPLLVEEVELVPVSHARFEAVEHDARVWADAHHHEPAATALPLPEVETATLQDALPEQAAGPVRFACRDELPLPALLSCEMAADEETLALFQKHLEKPPSFVPQGSQGAHEACDERAWISEVAAECRKAAPAETAPEEPRAMPAWALHVEELEIMETIDLQPVDLATLSRAA